MERDRVSHRGHARRPRTCREEVDEVSGCGVGWQSSELQVTAKLRVVRCCRVRGVRVDDNEAGTWRVADSSIISDKVRTYYSSHRIHGGFFFRIEIFDMTNSDII